MSHEKRKRRPTKVANTEVEIEKTTIRALLTAASRLTLGSVSFIVGFLGVMAAGGLAVGEWRGHAALNRAAKQHADELSSLHTTHEAQVSQLVQDRERARSEVVSLVAERDHATGELAETHAAREKFSVDFATRVLDPEVIELLRRAVAQDDPDGFEDPQWLLASLVWQLKSQNGWAEFLAGAEAHRVELRFNEDGEIAFDWDDGPSAVVEILTQVLGEYDEHTLVLANESINRYGFFPVTPDQIVVRGIDGGILLASPGY